MLKEKTPNIKALLGKLANKGLFHVFGANTLNKAMAFFTNIAIVWFLSKEEYGVFSYAMNIYSIVLLVTGFGLLAGMLQLCSENRPNSEQSSIYHYVLSRGLFIDAAICLTLMAAGFLLTLPIEESGTYLAMFGPLVVLDYLFQYASIALRSKRENKAFALLQTVNTVAYFFGACAGAYFWGIAGTILGRYIAYTITVALAIPQLRKAEIRFWRTAPLSIVLKKDLWRYSIPTQISSSINQLTFLLDVFLVGLFVANAFDVATYKVATLIPEGMLFIPSSFIIFAFPYFVRHNREKTWFLKNASALIIGGGVAYAAIAVVLIAAAPFVITLIWGEAYIEAVLPFRILSLCFAFSAIRTTCTNLLCALRAVRSNLVVSTVSLAINVLFCTFLIPSYGIVGAALAPCVVSILAAIVAAALLVRSVKRI